MVDTKRPCKAPDYQMEMLDDEIILFHPSSKAIFYSNTTGALIWGLCDGQRTVADISEVLSNAYPDSTPQITEDVQQTLQKFAQHGAIVWR